MVLSRASVIFMLFQHFAMDLQDMRAYLEDRDRPDRGRSFASASLLGIRGLVEGDLLTVPPKTHVKDSPVDAFRSTRSACVEALRRPRFTHTRRVSLEPDLAKQSSRVPRHCERSTHLFYPVFQLTGWPIFFECLPFGPFFPGKHYSSSPPHSFLVYEVRI